MNTQTDTEIVHIGRKSQNECAVMVSAGKRSFKALWDSSAGRCVISYECYNKIAPKFKSDLFTSDIRLKAANGTFIRNKGECEISFKIGQEGFRFPFLCSDQLSQELLTLVHIGMPMMLCHLPEMANLLQTLCTQMISMP